MSILSRLSGPKNFIFKVALDSIDNEGDNQKVDPQGRSATNITVKILTQIHHNIYNYAINLYSKNNSKPLLDMMFVALILVLEEQSL